MNLENLFPPSVTMIVLLLVLVMLIGLPTSAVRPEKWAALEHSVEAHEAHGERV